MSALSVDLPADSASAGLARRHVTQALQDAALQPLLDDALLLVTELVTNAVVHAGTAIGLHVQTSEDQVRIEVSDGSPGSIPTPEPHVEESREGGRGLFLLEALAPAWGSTHDRTGKSIWFCLGTQDHPVRATTATLPGAAPELTLADVGWLLAIGDRVAELGTAHVVRELLHRLAEGLGTGSALLAQPDGSGSWDVAQHVGPDLGVTAEEARRALQSGGPTAVIGGALVLPLGGSRGAVVLAGAAGLDPSRAALARLAADRLTGLLQDESTRLAALRDRGALALLAEASEMFAGALDVSLAATLLCQLIVPRFGSWAAVYDTAGHRSSLLAATHSDEREVASLQVTLSSTAARALADRLASTGPHARPALVEPEHLSPGMAPGGGDVLAVPLVVRRRTLGVLLLERSEHGALADDVSVLVDLTRRAALAIEGARLYEERSAVARALQSSLLPPVLPTVSGLSFGARYAAAGEGNEVGGDFYDVFPTTDGTWAVAIGDVCGKGPEAATITGLARNVLRLMLEQGVSPEEAFRRLNTAILDLGDRGRFLTTALALLEPHEHGVRVRLATAGHPPPVLVDATGVPRLLPGGGTLLGVTPDIDAYVQELDLAVGDYLVLYTDGVTERRDGSRWFGDASLQQALAVSSGRSPDAVAGHLEQQVRAFGAAAASDDLAVLVVSATGAVPAPAPRAQESVSAG